MNDAIGERVAAIGRLYRDEFPMLRFLEPDPAPLRLSLEGAVVSRIRFEIRGRQCLHLHSIGLATVAPSTPAIARVVMSSCYGDAGNEAAAARLLDASGEHGYAFHTDNEADPWVEVTLDKPVGVHELVVNNRAGPVSHRAANLVVRISEDGDSWRTVHDGEAVTARFTEAAMKTTAAARGTVEDVASRLATEFLSFQYGAADRTARAAALPAQQMSVVRNAINGHVLSARGMEWTSHGVRRSFRFWTEKEKADYVGLAMRVCRDLLQLSPDVCLGFGSVLSVVRDGRLMDHDDDLDIIIGLDSATTPTLRIALATVRGFLIAKGYKIKGSFFSHWHVWRGGKKVDVFVGLYEGDRIGWFPGKRRALARSDVFPSREVDFLGSRCLIPKDAEKYLATIYGPQWRSPAPGWKHDWDRASYLDIA